MDFKDSQVFDLTKYDLTSSNVYPYFDIKQKGSEFFVYEGATGNDRFLYYKIPEGTKAADLCKQFLENKNKNVQREHDLAGDYADFEKLMDACRWDEIEEMIGLDAWLKYWNDCCQENKHVIHFGLIHHLTALKEWYILNLKREIDQKESDLRRWLSNIEANTEIKKFQTKTAEDVKNFLSQGSRDKDRKFQHITVSHANELIQFYEWILAQDIDIRHLDYSLLSSCDLNDKDHYLIIPERSINPDALKRAQECIDKFGYIQSYEPLHKKYYKLFDAEFATLFNAPEIILRKMEDGQMVIHRMQLISPYFQGFIDGEAYFDSLFPKSTIINDPDSFIYNLHCHCNHIYHNERYIYVTWYEGFKKTYPTISKGNLANTGYYAGIQSRMHDIFNDYPIIKAKFKSLKCLDCTNPQETAVISENKTITCLKDVAISEIALENIFRILIDNGLIDKDTKIFRDKNNGNKGHFYSTILLFYEKGYFIREPTRKEYMKICENDFRLTISEASAKNHKTRASSSVIIPQFTQN